MEQRADQTVEIKAWCQDLERIRKILLSLGATAAGCETQIDTFYRVPQGRLKLRQSKSENLLIGYQRPNTPDPKHCLVNLYACSDPEALGRVLADALGIRIVVKKERERYTLANVKFHLDRVEGLGSFVEIEVLGYRSNDSVKRLQATCENYMHRLGIKRKDLVAEAYADLLEKGSLNYPPEPKSSLED